jgi:hypothetical protein
MMLAPVHILVMEPHAKFDLSVTSSAPASRADGGVATQVRVPSPGKNGDFSATEKVPVRRRRDESLLC